MSTNLPLDRIPSCATSSSVLLVPSRVANLFAIAFEASEACEGIEISRDTTNEGNRNYYLLFIKITIAPSRLSKLQFLQLLHWLTNKEKLFVIVFLSLF